MQSKAKTVARYLAELPLDRRASVQAVRKVILKNLPRGYEEGMQYGMISYYVPHTIYPDGYHCDSKQPLPFVSLASQKNHLSLYMMCIYGESDHAAWFHAELAKTGEKLDMGKACIRFKKVDDLPLDLIGRAIKRIPVKTYIDWYEAAIKQAIDAKSSQNKTARRTPPTKAKSVKKKSPKTTRATPKSP